MATPQWAWHDVEGPSFLFFSFFKTEFLCVADYPGTDFVDQAVLKLRDLPVSASQALRLKTCAITPGFTYVSKRSWNKEEPWQKTSLFNGYLNRMAHSWGIVYGHRLDLEAL